MIIIIILMLGWSWRRRRYLIGLGLAARAVRLLWPHGARRKDFDESGWLL